MPAPLTLAAVRQPAFLYDTDGRIAEANELAVALAGRPLTGCSTGAVLDIFDPRGPDGTPLTASDLPEARALAGDEAVNVPLMVTAGDGRTVHLLASASPLREKNAIAGALVIWQDVSALVSARAGAESSAAELEAEQEELRQQGDDLHRTITELDRQRRLLDTILASLPHRVSLWNRDRRLTWANERFAAERGLARGALLGRPWAEIGYDPSIIAPLAEETVQATPAGRVLSGELQTAGSGGTTWLSFKAMPIFGDSVLVISEEITGRKEAEEQLRLATACARIGMWEWHRPGDGDPESGDYVRLNDSALPDPVRIDAWQETVHPDDLERVEAERDAALARGEPFELEFRYAPEPGTVGWMRVLGGGIFDEQGRLLRVLGVNMDITDQKRAGEALRESEEKYRRLVNDDITGHVITSPDGRIQDCNPAFARIFGFASVEEARASSMIETYDTPGDREARMARLRVERRFENEEGFRRRRDGTRIHIVENVIGDFDDDGNLVQIRGYINDDTERHRAREELQESERRHTFLLALGDRLRELSDVPGIMAVASELLGRHLGANRVVYCEVDPAHEHAIVRADWNDGTVPRLTGRFRMDDFGIGDCYRRGLVRRTEDVAGEHGRDEAAEHEVLAIRASLGVPILRGGRLAAVLAVHSARPRAWTDEEVELVRQAGDRVFASVERARAEQALRLSEERLRLAQEGARIGIWDRDAVTDRVTITPGFLRPYGLEETAISSYADLVPLIHPDDLEQVEAGRRAAFAANTSLNLEFRVITPTGEARWVQFKGHGFPGGEGPPSRVIGVLIDVTDRKRAEAALLEREQTMQSIFRAAPIGIGMVTHRTITQANEQLCRMTGYSREELIGQDARLFYPSDEAYDYVGREKYAQIAESGTGAVETQWRTKDGTPLDILISSSPVDLSRPHEDVVFNALDITRLRESERALESYMDDLQRSNEELQRFAYVASHDLQEPLRSIISFSQLLERRYRGKLDQDADEFIQFIVEGGNRMQQLITDLLQLSRVETKARPLVPTDAGEVAADAIRLMETPIREAGATVTVEALPTVMADGAQLAQVFTNLVGNALKYRRPDVPLTVRISAGRRGKFWRFAVEDNGIGIEAEYFDRIFVIFQRLHTRDEYPGTGIGLAVVRRIVERHGGRIGVESTPGEGSTFFFTLPAA